MRRIGDAVDLTTFAAEHGYPMVLKRIAGAASLGMRGWTTTRTSPPYCVSGRTDGPAKSSSPNSGSTATCITWTV